MQRYFCSLLWLIKIPLWMEIIWMEHWYCKELIFCFSCFHMLYFDHVNLCVLELQNIRRNKIARDIWEYLSVTTPVASSFVVVPKGTQTERKKWRERNRSYLSCCKTLLGRGERGGFCCFFQWRVNLRKCELYSKSQNAGRTKCRKANKENLETC